MPQRTGVAHGKVHRNEATSAVGVLPSHQQRRRPSRRLWPVFDQPGSAHLGARRPRGITFLSISVPV
jgi:hypothetical protein